MTPVASVEMDPEPKEIFQPELSKPELLEAVEGPAAPPAPPE